MYKLPTYHLYASYIASPHLSSHILLDHQSAVQSCGTTSHTCHPSYVIHFVGHVHQPFTSLFETRVKGQQCVKIVLPHQVLFANCSQGCGDGEIPQV